MIYKLKRFFVRSILFPFQEILKGHSTVAIKNQLEKSQWWSKEQLEDARLKRLKLFLQEVYQQVPYYQGMFDEQGFIPDEINCLDDLSKLPFLTKEVIRNNEKALVSKQAKNISPFTTGGSSGTPLTFMLGKERVSHDVAEKWRATRWWDVDLGDKEIVAWGSPIELGSQDKIKLIRDQLFRSKLIPAFDLTDEKIIGFIDEIKRYKPKMLFGYPSVFALMAKVALKHGIDLTQLGIKVVFVTSERLYPYQRDIIESTFNSPVANGYGSRDAGFIAHQCPAGGMHISAEDMIVEIVDSAENIVPDGVQGEIIVTHMATSDFPFIRYKTGDIGALSTKACACGRSLPLLEQIEGRTTDFVIAEDGTMMHGLALIYVLRELSGIEEFKIIQETQLLTNILIVPTGSVSQELNNKIVEGIKARLGSNVVVNLDVVSAIPAEKSGKFRYVISKVES